MARTMKLESTDVFRAVVTGPEGNIVAVYGPQAEKGHARDYNTTWGRAPGTVVSKQKLEAYADVEYDELRINIKDIKAGLRWVEIDKKEYTS